MVFCGYKELTLGAVKSLPLTTSKNDSSTDLHWPEIRVWLLTLQILVSIVSLPVLTLLSLVNPIWVLRQLAVVEQLFLAHT